jgi:hypothetical protein
MVAFIDMIVVVEGSMDDTIEKLRTYGYRISWTSERDQVLSMRSSRASRARAKTVQSSVPGER